MGFGPCAVAGVDIVKMATMSRVATKPFLIISNFLDLLEAISSLSEN